MSSKLSFYRQCRLWHGYLSAFAFAALLFFATTGLLLNHPRWFAETEPRSSPVKFTLTPAQLQKLQKAQAPARVLTKMIAERTTLYGEYQDGEADMGRIFVRLRGARGSSDIRANIQDGSIAVVLERATTMGLLNALHRGAHTGAAWRAFIDISAGILIGLSFVGYVIFFSMRTRLTAALLITGVSMLGIVTVFVAAVR